MRYFLGIDVGGTKSHALAADETGQAIGFGSAGPGSWEGVGYAGLTRTLQAVSAQALQAAGLAVGQVAAAGMGLAGYDWPSQRQAHLDAIRPLGLRSEPCIVNDAVLGILAGAEGGWGLSIVSGTGCNCRGWSRDHHREARAVGGMPEWSGEAAGGYDIAARAMRAVAHQWTGRGPATALAAAFLEKTGARDLDDLVEGVYLNRYPLDQSMARMVFAVAAGGDAQALEVVRWAGDQLGQMACGAIRQLDLQNEAFDVVLIGSLFDGHPLLAETLAETVHGTAPAARLVRLTAPPVVGGVLLGMEQAGLNGYAMRDKLIRTTKEMLKKE